MILIGINLEKIGSVLNAHRLPAETSFGIFDSKGVFLYRTAHANKFIGKQDQPHLFEQMKNGPEEGIIDIVSNDGVHRMAAYRKIRLSDDQPPYAYIRGGIPLDHIVNKANSSIAKNLTILSGMLLLGFTISLLISRRCIVKRISALHDASQRLAAGDYRVNVDKEVEGGELGKLAEAFNTMVGKLIQREKALAASERFLNTVIDTERSVSNCLMPIATFDDEPGRAWIIEADSFEQVQEQCVCS